MNFYDALNTYESAEEAAIDAKWARRVAEAEATLTAEGKNQAERDAHVTLACADAGRDADTAALRAKAAEHIVLYLRGQEAK